MNISFVIFPCLRILAGSTDKSKTSSNLPLTRHHHLDSQSPENQIVL